MIVEVSRAVAESGSTLLGSDATTGERRRSLPYLVAHALVTGGVGLTAVTHDGAVDDTVNQVMSRIEVRPFRGRRIQPAVRLISVFGNGSQAEIALPHHEAQTIRRELLLAKLADCWKLAGQPAYRRPIAIMETVDAIDRTQSLAAFWSVVSPQAIA
jgi:hypothetical protein